MILAMVGPSVRISLPWKPSGQAMGGSSLNGGEGKDREVSLEGAGRRKREEGREKGKNDKLCLL